MTFAGLRPGGAIRLAGATLASSRWDMQEAKEGRRRTLLQGRELVTSMPPHAAAVRADISCKIAGKQVCSGWIWLKRPGASWQTCVFMEVMKETISCQT
eukprot:757007-Hanusia_phi.AAC.5